QGGGDQGDGALDGRQRAAAADDVLADDAAGARVAGLRVTAGAAVAAPAARIARRAVVRAERLLLGVGEELGGHLDLRVGLAAPQILDDAGAGQRLTLVL